MLFKLKQNVYPVTISVSQVITRYEKATKLSTNLATWTSIQNKPSNTCAIPRTAEKKRSIVGPNEFLQQSNDTQTDGANLSCSIILHIQGMDVVEDLSQTLHEHGCLNEAFVHMR